MPTLNRNWDNGKVKEGEEDFEFGSNGVIQVLIMHTKKFLSWTQKFEIFCLSLKHFLLDTRFRR
jgi:hypothetical protein